MMKPFKQAWWAIGLLLMTACADQGNSGPTPAAHRLAASDPAIAHASAMHSAWRYTSAPDRGVLLEFSQPQAAKTEGAYSWRPVEISEDHALSAIGAGRHIAMIAPDGRKLSFKYQRHIEHEDGTWTWVGTLPGQPGEETILTFGAKAIFGSISQGRGELPLQVTLRDGRPWLVSTDRAQLSGLGKWFTDPTESDALVPPVRPARKANARVKAAAAAGGPVTFIDVLAGYTTGLALSLGGDSQARTRINFLVDVGNQAHLNAQTSVQLRLVGAIAVSYPDATKNSKTLDELTGVDSERSVVTAPNPAFDALRAAREEYGADLVTLVRKFNTPENDSCGVAWLNGGAQSAIVPSQDEFYGYSVISDGSDFNESDNKNYFCRQENLVHELGHNMGSVHDTANSSSTGAYPYSYGYKTGPSDGNFYTVMAYGDSGQSAYRTFSNPDITFCGGFACGIANQSDNARSLRQTGPLVAQFRESLIAGTGYRVQSDVNGDGKADVTWYNGATGSVYHWIMDGTIISNGFSGGSAGPGTNDHSVADFDADGRADLVYTTATEVRVLLASGTGLVASQRVADRLGASWRIAAVGDVNLDGRADIAWHDTRTGNICYWLMEGASLLESRCGFWIGGGQTVRAAGDFNGDGRVDLLFSDNSRLMMRLGGAEPGTGSTFVADHPQGWLIAGAGDLDGDRKADIVWHNGGTGQVYTWFMNGQIVRGGSAGPVLPLGYAARSVADFNGDGAVDALFSNNADVKILIGNGTGFTSNPVAPPPAGWALVVNRPTKPASLIRSDINADGLSDVILHSSAGFLSHWRMDGTARTSIGGQVSLPAGYSPRAQADFTGDGFADILISNGSNLRMLFGTGNGTYVTAEAGAHPFGWMIVGAGDLNGDGKSDVVWHNPDSGEIYYWLMNGAAIFDGRGGFFPGAGQTLRTVADMDGDGRSDLVFSNGSQVRLLQATNAGGFENLLIGNHTEGWNIVEAGDADDDGKADLFWHHPASGALYAWSMDGALIRTGRSVGSLPTGMTPRSLVDLDGDGRADLIADDGAFVRAYLGPGLATAGGVLIGELGNGWLPLRAN